MENLALGFVSFALFKRFLGLYFWYELLQTILLCSKLTKTILS